MKKLSRIFLVPVLILLSASQTFAYSDFHSPEEIFKLYSDKKTEFNVLIYFNGLGSGISWMHTTSGGEPIYCQPDQKSHSAEDYFSLYRIEYFRNKDFYDSLEFQPPGFILKNGIIAEYPCN